MKTEATIKGLVLKVASRCNLNCEYCYMYNLGDETYKAQPKFMSQSIVNNLLNKVGTYLTQSGSKTFTFIFHGGEPLLVGYDFYRNFVRKAKELLPAYTIVDYILQTNGVLLTDEWCRVLGSLDVRIGISLDGLTEVANKYRIDHQGKSSLMATLKGFSNTHQSKYLKYLPGILSVINLESNPAQLYQGYKELKVKHLNFLFPDGTYDNLPKGYKFDEINYADWLIELFDLWFFDKDPQKPQIGIFNHITNLVLGGHVKYDSFGEGDNIFLIIETNGDIEPQDSLKACGDSFTKTNLNITTHTLEDSFNQPLIKFCIDSQQTLCQQCQNCSVVEVCRGGYITHRYSRDRGFDNPSIHCKDFEKLITYISERISDVLTV
ncbi:MAG: 4Fe-4S cluster-binding domain-containing protein [Arcicella sp.]|jgi:uncharacterized protein|nr:4Fe-4S cluster-binding domain-containing protein [Arcicella sp.]